MGEQDRRELRLLIVLLLAAVVAIAVLGIYLLPAALPLLDSLEAGMGLKDAALWGFGVTLGVFVLLAVVAGDGLIGEIQFLLGSFFGFFLILTLLIAWIF
jgi:hypothetical protein